MKSEPILPHRFGPGPPERTGAVSTLRDTGCSTKTSQPPRQRVGCPMAGNDDFIDSFFSATAMLRWALLSDETESVGSMC